MRCALLYDIVQNCFHDQSQSPSVLREILACKHTTNASKCCFHNVFQTAIKTVYKATHRLVHDRLFYECVDPTMMSINDILYFLLCTQVTGSHVFPPKCLEEYKKDSLMNINFCIQGTQNSNQSIELCQPAEYLNIVDFTLHLPRESEKNCGILDGFAYKNTVTASCLQKENKTLTQRIARTLITAYNGEKFKHVNKTQVQAELNNIVKQLALINIKYLCNPAENNTFIDICKNANVEGWNKGNIVLDISSLDKLNPKPASCVCSVRSSQNNVTIKALDVRLGPNENLQITQENSLSVSDLFKDSSFTWSKEDQKVLASDFVNITFKIKDLTFKESLWIEIEGRNMSVYCSPLYSNDSDTTVPTKEPQNQSGGLSLEIIIGIAVGVVVLVVIIIIVSCMIHRRRNNIHNGSMTEMEDSFTSKQSDNKAEVIYSEPGTPTPVSDSPEKPLMTNYFELEQEHVYAEPGPANNNSKNITTFGQQRFSIDKNKETVTQKNIYNHLGERPAISHGNIYDTSALFLTDCLNDLPSLMCNYIINGHYYELLNFHCYLIQF
ncbi:hypothetical protein Btru_077085 [Bulinus truncatus]|nr:hypothetical protein Btru_077085 [Bulinus truncatus]